MSSTRSELPAIAGGDPIRSEYLVFGKPSIGDAEIREVVACMKSAWLGTGPRVAAFEQAFRAYSAAPEAVAVSSCTAALHLSMLAGGLEPGDEVITPPLTFCATANAIEHARAVPVLADIDPETLNLDPASVERAITPRTRALLPVHFAGRPCDMSALCEIAAERSLQVIEDCAHAIETQIDGQHVGTFGAYGCFSFYATKNVTTGEGGMVLAQREEDAARIKRLALHGMSQDAWGRYSDEGFKHYYVVECGFKYNMMDIQAAIGLHQLERIEENWKRREHVWTRYLDAFADLPLGLPPPVAPNTRHAYHLFTVQIDEDRAGISRDRFLEALNAENIGTGVHYQSLAEHPYYQSAYGWLPEQTPEAMRVGRSIVSLPLSAGLIDEDIDDVIVAVRRLLEHCAA